MTQHPKQPDQNKMTLHDKVRHAMVEQGWIIPVTAEEVCIAEEAIAQASEDQLPASLTDPLAVLDGPCRQLKVAKPPVPQAEASVSDFMARAAREGKTISPETEAKMKADREAARRDDGKE